MMMSAWASTAWVNAVSRPVGARTRTRSRPGSARGSTGDLQHLLRAAITRDAGHDSLELAQGLSHQQPILTEPQLADRFFMRADALLHHADRLADPAGRFEVTEKQDVVAEIAEVDRAL